METETERIITDSRACVNFEKFTKYIQKEYRKNLNEVDYEILKTIAKTYTREEILKAVAYCKKQKSNSLKYLQDALSKKYYEALLVADKPKWMDKELGTEYLTIDDLDFVKEFYGQFCDTEEEMKERIKGVIQCTNK